MSKQALFDKLKRRKPEPMRIAAGRLVMDFHNNDKVAIKHREIDKLCKDLRRKFNVSVLEVADFEDPERRVIGFAAVIPETWTRPKAQSFLDHIRETIDTTSFARVTVEDCELLDFT